MNYETEHNAVTSTFNSFRSRKEYEFSQYSIYLMCNLELIVDLSINTERNDFVIETNQGKVNVILKTIDLLRLQINSSV